MEEIRKQAENLTRFYAVYVVDDHEKLVGHVSLQQLILTDPRTIVNDIYEEVISVETYLEDLEVAEIMKKLTSNRYRSSTFRASSSAASRSTTWWTSLPSRPRKNGNSCRGSPEDVEEDDSIWRNTRARLPWLLIGILGGTMSARFMGFFELQIARITAISFRAPDPGTAAMSGYNLLRWWCKSLVNPGFVVEGLGKRLAKVFSVALVNGVFLSLIVFGVNSLIFGYEPLNVVVSLALFCVVLFASFIGTLTPLLLNRFGFNPALASGPFITTTNDLVGLAIYFLTIHLLL